MDTLSKLFEDTVKDLYNAESNFLKSMPKLAKGAQSGQLKNGIQAHIEQTQLHISRLDELARSSGFKPTGKACKASVGLVDEANEHLEEYETGPILDAAIITCVQKDLHYEICSYGALIGWAKELGLTDAVELLQKTLEEEEQTNRLLGKVATTSVNKQANQVGSVSDPRSNISVM